MLSATAGADVAGFDSISDAVEQDSGEPAIAVPLLCGTSLLVCPVAAWSEGERAEIAPTSGEETTDTSQLIGTSTGELSGCWLPVCTLPPQAFSLTGDDESGDSGDPTGVEPSVVDPGSADGSDSGVDPLIIVDPVEPLPPFEPLDIRVQFVSSGEEWACYFYSVGPDGVVTNVSVLASFNEPTIATFVADHADDGSFSIEDYGRGWSISNFPIDLAPPVPETYDVYAVAGTDLLTDETTGDPILMVCDGGFLPREYSGIDPAEAVDPQARSVAVVATPAALESSSSAQSSVGMPFNVMAAFAASSSASGGETTVPFGSGRRRR